jgi:hypothetical protein
MPHDTFVKFKIKQIAENKINIYDFYTLPNLKRDLNEKNIPKKMHK